MPNHACLDACGRLDNTVPRPCSECAAGKDNHNPSCVHLVDRWADDGATYRRLVRARVNSAAKQVTVATCPAMRHERAVKELDMRRKRNRIKFRGMM
jgi:hypothetical protein